MAFERPSRNVLVFVCDVCGDTIEIVRPGGTHDFRECWQEAREEGWRINHGEHYCGSCTALT